MPASQSPIGTRSRLVTVEQRTASVGSSGFPVETWADLADVWMANRELRANERGAMDEHSAHAEMMWTCEYRSDLDPEVVNVPSDRRLHYSGRVYDIKSAWLMDWRRQIALETIAKVDRL